MEKFNIFCKTLDNLRQIKDYIGPFDAVTEAGLIGLFSICFEQAWKAMKDILERYGYDHMETNSPKMVVKLAHQAGIIKDVDGWLHALEARNKVPQAYDRKVAESIISMTKKEFLRIFSDLEREIEKNWI